MSTIPNSSAFLSNRVTSRADPEVYKRSPSLASVAGAAINSEWVASWAWRTANAEWAYTPNDDNYFAPDDSGLWKELTRDVAPDYWGEIARANNPVHALAIADNMRSVTRSRATLEAAGTTGLVASIGAAILDPVSLAAGFGAGGVVGKASLASGRLGKFALGGLAGVGTEGGIETFLASQDPDRGVNDIIIATIGSFALGGLGEAATRGNWGSLIAKAAERDRKPTVAAMGAAAGGEFDGTTLGKAAADVEDLAGVQFHGTSSVGDIEVRGLRDDSYTSLNYYGQGFYTTDSQDIARGYSKKGRGTDPGILVVRKNRDLKFFDMEAPLSAANRSRFAELLEIEEGNLPDNANLRQMYDEFRDSSKYEGLTRDDVQQNFRNVQEVLEQSGYDGLVHTGGLRTGKSPHRVEIVWDPSDKLAVKRLAEGKAAAAAEDPNDVFRRDVSRGNLGQYLFHGTEDIDNAATISDFGLSQGGITNNIDEAISYADPSGSGEGIVIVFRADDVPGGDRIEHAIMDDEYEAFVQGGDVPPSQLTRISSPIASYAAITVTEARAMRAAIVDKASYVRAVLEEKQLPSDFIDDIVSDPARVDAEYGALTYPGDPDTVRNAPDGGGPPDEKPPAGPDGEAEDDPFELPPSQLGDFDPSRANDGAAKWTNVRASFASVLSNPQVPAPVRRVMNMLIDDVLPKVGNQASTYAASMWTHTKIQATRSAFHKTMRNSFAEFSKATGIRGRRGIETFAKDVLNAVERPEILDGIADTPASRAIRAAAKHVSNLFESQLGMMQRHGVAGMDKFDTNRRYIPLMLSQAKVRAAVVALGEPKVVDFLATALVRGSEDLDMDTARTVAKMKLRVMQDLGKYADIDRFKNFSGRQLEAVRHIIEAEPLAEGLSDTAIENIMSRIDEVASDAESGVPSFGRKRTNWDLSYVEDLNTKGGDVLRNQTVRDLLYDTNLFNIVERYVRTATGASALHRTWNEAAKAMGRKTPFRTRQAFESAVEDTLRANNIDTANGFGRKFLEHLRVAQKHIAGVPIFDEDQSLQRASRVLRKYNYVVRSGGFGFAQLPELGKVMGFAGVINTVNSVPILKSFSKKFPNEMMETAEILGLGSDYWINETLSHLDPDDLIAFEGNRLLDRAEQGLTRASRVGSFLSGFNYVNAGLQRLNTVATIQKFVSDAVGNRPWNATKLAALGLSADDAARVFKAISDEVARGVAIKREPGIMAKRVTAFHLSKFQDQEAAQRLLESINTFSRRVVQDSTLGSSLMLMHKPWAKLMLQFQNFALQSWEKQLLYSGVTRTDPRTWAAAMLGTLAGALVYTGQQHLYSIGRADKDEFLEKRLGTPEERAMRIFRAGAQRSGVFSVLPWGTDFMATALGIDPVFDARNTELSFRDPAGGFSVLGPSSSSIGDAWRAMQGISTGLTGDDYSEGDFSALRRLAPWQGVPILRNFLDVIGSRLGVEEPDESR